MHAVAELPRAGGLRVEWHDLVALTKSEMAGEILISTLENVSDIGIAPGLSLGPPARPSFLLSFVTGANARAVKGTCIGC